MAEHVGEVFLGLLGSGGSQTWGGDDDPSGGILTDWQRQWYPFPHLRRTNERDDCIISNSCSRTEMIQPGTFSGEKYALSTVAAYIPNGVKLPTKH